MRRTLGLASAPRNHGVSGTRPGRPRHASGRVAKARRLRHGAGMALPRLQLFEFNDAPWAPPALRAMIVESLSLALERGRLLDGLAAPVIEFLRLSGEEALLDLGAGSGAPAKVLLRALAEAGHHPRLTLSDLHPRVADWERLRAERPDQVDFVAGPLDATAIPATFGDHARIIVNVLHHFPPALVQAVIADAVRAGRGLFIAESFGRNPVALAGFAKAGLPALYTSPLRGEERLVRCGFMWASPIALMAALWDGLVSTMRIYEEADLRRLIAGVPGADTFEWRFGRYPVTRLGDGVWCMGLPRR